MFFQSVELVQFRRAYSHCVQQGCFCLTKWWNPEKVSMSRNFESQELEYEMYREPSFGSKEQRLYVPAQMTCAGLCLLSQERRSSLHSSDTLLSGARSVWPESTFSPTLDFLLGKFLLSHFQIQLFSATPVKWTQSLGWFVITKSSTLKYMLFECS